MKKVDVLIVGAGPGGLFLADYLTKNIKDKKIVIIDIGKSIKERICSLVNYGVCAKCDTCSLVYGSGGAGMYSDGKLSCYPAGSGLVEQFGNTELVRSTNQFIVESIKQIGSSADSEPAISCETDVKLIQNKIDSSSLILKSYDVHFMGTEGIQNFCEGFEQKLIRSGVEFNFQKKVIDADRTGQGFRVAIIDEKGRQSEFETANLVFATGKPSGLLLRNILTKLGAEWKYNNIELGIRVETQHNAIVPLTRLHKDAKLKLNGDYDCKIRTFCMCHGGYILNCYYDDFYKNKKICTISGFSFRDKKSENSNFGLLVRRKFPQDIDPVAIYRLIISAINQLSGSNGTVVQRYEDFKLQRPTTYESLHNNTIKSTLKNATPVDLQWVLPAYVSHNVKLFLEKLTAIDPRIGSDDTLLHAPVLELTNDEVLLNESLETTVDGLYVVGDASGVARGIVQAGSTGIIAAKNIANNLKIYQNVA